MTRARLIAATGHADNQAVLMTPPQPLGAPASRTRPDVGLPILVPQMDQWLTGIAADQKDGGLSKRIIRNKPAALADGCIAIDGERIVEPASYHGRGRCNEMYPVHGNPRVAAGLFRLFG